MSCNDGSGSHIKFDSAINHQKKISPWVKFSFIWIKVCSPSHFHSHLHRILSSLCLSSFLLSTVISLYISLFWCCDINAVNGAVLLLVFSIQSVDMVMRWCLTCGEDIFSYANWMRLNYPFLSYSVNIFSISLCATLCKTIWDKTTDLNRIRVTTILVVLLLFVENDAAVFLLFIIKQFNNSWLKFNAR